MGQADQSRSSPEQRTPMNICIVGQGKVGTALGAGLTAAGHFVSYGGRDNVADLQRDPML
jgi:prephenate dehydrogenase